MSSPLSTTDGHSQDLCSQYGQFEQTLLMLIFIPSRVIILQYDTIQANRKYQVVINIIIMHNILF